MYSMCMLLPLTALEAQACDRSHSDCLTESHYKTIAECNRAIARDKTDVHAFLDRAVLETKAGLDEAAVADFHEAGALLEADAKAPVKIAKSTK
jgi:hypothetical protein